MSETSRVPKRRRPWGAALLGSAAVALAIAVVMMSASNAVVGNIGSIAVVTIVVLALWTARQRSCHATSSTRPRR
jgi:hypothetical protein